MAQKELHETIDIPEGVTVTMNGNTIIAKGAKGELSREVQARGVKVSVEGSEIHLDAPKVTQREKKLLYTYRAHIRNLLLGVNEGFNYKLKICSGHFPMSVAVKGDTFEIKNFIGEKVPRTVKLKAGVKVHINGDIIEVEATDKELAGQAAADIEKMTRRPQFDKRVFQDGIYITEKAGKPV